MYVSVNVRRMCTDLTVPAARADWDGILIEIKFLADKSINSMAFILREAENNLFEFLYKIKSLQHFSVLKDNNPHSSEAATQ